MKLRWLPINHAWAFVFGRDSIAAVEDQRFFSTPSDAVQAAERAGLAVGDNNNVSVKQEKEKHA